MIKLFNCPSCTSSSLKLLKTFKFTPPANIAQEIPDENISYSEERLWIFFKKIWKKNSPAEINMVLCGNCGLIFTNPRYTEEEISEKYLTVSQLPSAKLRIENNPALYHEKRARRIYKLISKYTENQQNKSIASPSKKILDVGGAEGYNLLPFLLNGDDCYLLDFIKKDLAKGITYLGEEINSLKAEDKFDVILFCHTLEHVTNPAEIVKQLKSHLKPDGLLYIEVPMGSWKEWSRLKEPLTHVNFFSEESLYKTVKASGADVVHLSTDYQWVTHNKIWCVNIISKNSNSKTITNYQSTKSQMKYFKYAFLMFLQEPGLLLKSIEHKLKNLA